MPLDSDQPIADVETRSAHKIPAFGQATALPAEFVTLHHPGWANERLSPLFTLPKCSLNHAKQPCAEYLVALHGCYVIAIDRPGFFTKQRNRESDRVPFGQALTENHYWYHLDSNEDPSDAYPTLQSFRHWQFRPAMMPNIWREAVPWTGQEDNDQTDGACCISGDDCVEKAHLIAKTEWKWWMENNMTNYANLTGVATRITMAAGQEIDVPANRIALSDSLHRQWDNDVFCLFPLNVAKSDTYRLHCIFILEAHKGIRCHHRRPLRGGLRNVSAACAYARFVYAILQKHEATFFSKDAKRLTAGTGEAARWVEYSDLLQQRLDRIKNTSPTKRGRSGGSQKRGSPSSPAEEELHRNISHSPCYGCDCYTCCISRTAAFATEFEERGRSLKRRREYAQEHL